MEAVPRVDLRDAVSSSGRAGFARTLREGLLATGFVRVVGHGVDPALVARVHDLFAEFFACDEATKRAAGGVPGGQRGFTPFGVEHAKDVATPDLKEFFHVGQEPGEQSALRTVYPANVWPEKPAGLREASLALYRSLEETAEVLLRAIEDAFALPAETLAGMLREGNSILRAAHYPPVTTPPPIATPPPVVATPPPIATPPPAAAREPAVRAAPHEDINLITLLCGATDEGLELRTTTGRWLEVPARPGEIVADVGDMLARVTNRRLPATTHRVVARGEAARRHRYSLPFFAHPRPECDLSVLPAFLEPGEAPRFAPITAAAFLEERLREIGLVS